MIELVFSFAWAMFLLFVAVIGGVWLLAGGVLTIGELLKGNWRLWAIAALLLITWFVIPLL
jgi:hypothetical protein